MTDPLFSDNRLGRIHRRANENFNEQPELRDWLLSQLPVSQGVGKDRPGGYFCSRSLLP